MMLTLNVAADNWSALHFVYFCAKLLQELLIGIKQLERYKINQVHWTLDLAFWEGLWVLVSSRDSGQIEYVPCYFVEVLGVAPCSVQFPGKTLDRLTTSFVRHCVHKSTLARLHRRVIPRISTDCTFARRPAPAHPRMPPVPGRPRRRARTGRARSSVEVEFRDSAGN